MPLSVSAGPKATKLRSRRLLYVVERFFQGHTITPSKELGGCRRAHLLSTPLRLMKSAICGNIHRAPREDMLHDIQGHVERRTIGEKNAADHALPDSSGARRLPGRN